MIGINLTLPESQRRVFRHVVLDFNGTIARDGRLLSGVAKRLRHLARRVHVTVATADTFGTAREQLASLPITVHLSSSGAAKAELVDRLGGSGVVVIGNGTNDLAMFRRAGLRIAVLGPEGTASKLISEADVVCTTSSDALDLLLAPERLLATLRP